MPRHAQMKLQLYVAGETQNSLRAIANLATLCRKHLQERSDIEVVDVLKQPERAFADRILMTPTLIRVSPAPQVRIVGTLSDTGTVLRTLGLEAEAA